jgi:hypothetical protein
MAAPGSFRATRDSFDPAFGLADERPPQRPPERQRRLEVCKVRRFCVAFALSIARIHLYHH